MGNIKDLIESNEPILWEKIVAQDKPKERKFVITNKRVYKQSHDIPTKEFRGAPKDYLRVKEDILIVERVGIREIVIKEKRSLIDKLVRKIIQSKEGADKDQKFQENIERAKKSIEKGEAPEFSFDENTTQETVDKTLKYAKKIAKFLSRNRVLLYLHNATSNRPFMIIDKLSKEESDKVTELLQKFEAIAGDAFLPESLRTPYAEPTWPTNEPIRNVISRQPGQVETPPPSNENYLTPSSFKEDKCQVIEIIDLSRCQGKLCTYCGNDLTSYNERIFSCQGCGVNYHQSCLNMQIREGFCLNCNKTLIY
jgi:hypothetical protein